MYKDIHGQTHFNLAAFLILYWASSWTRGSSRACSLLKRNQRPFSTYTSLDQGLAYWWGVHLRWQSCLMYRITDPAERGSCVYLNPSSRHSDHSWQTGDRYCQSALFLKPPTLLCVFCKFGGVPASWPAEWHSLPDSEDSWASRRRDIQRLLPWYCWPRQKPAWLLEKARIVLVSTGLGRKVESGHRCGEKNVSLQRVCLFSLTKQELEVRAEKLQLEQLQ